MTPKPPAASNSWLWGVRLALGFTGVLIVLIAALVAVRVCAEVAGFSDEAFTYENGIGLWQRDARIGYANRPGFRGRCHGDVSVRINADGFRTGRVIARTAPPGVTRILALGDSVMWGTVVPEAQSLPALLERRLRAAGGQYEVLNAAVVGYSTLQEALLLERLGRADQPSLVLVGYGADDWLPTEDPFRTARSLYRQYLRQRLSDPRQALTPQERALVERFVRVLAEAPTIWTGFNTLQAEPGFRPLMRRLLIEQPVVTMAAQTAARGARFLYLFIPMREQSPDAREDVRALKAAFDRQGIAYLDLSPTLASSGSMASAMGPVAASGWAAGIAAALERPGVRARLAREPWRELDPLPALRFLGRLHTLHRLRNQRFLDAYHPGRPGNERLAARVAEHLLVTKQRTP